jgi:Fur family peroxide stress response transcriptional regulator
VRSHDHPTAEQIFRRVRRTVPRVSLGTVYRNLDKLREQGRLRVVRLEGGVAHYDAMVDAHDHFVCERCGAVVDLPGGPRPLDVDPLRAAGYDVHWHTTALYGLCKACPRPATPMPAARRHAVRRRRGSAARAL